MKFELYFNPSCQWGVLPLGLMAQEGVREGLTSITKFQVMEGKVGSQERSPYISLRVLASTENTRSGIVFVQSYEDGHSFWGNEMTTVFGEYPVYGEVLPSLHGEAGNVHVGGKIIFVTGGSYKEMYDLMKGLLGWLGHELV